MNNLKTKLQQSLYSFAQKSARYMQGRYGPDDMYKGLTWVIFVLIILELFIKKPLFNFLVLALIIYNSSRIFSKNYQKRYRENQLYLQYTKGIRNFISLTKKRLTDKDHVYRTCPNCSKTLRLPRKKGKHNVCCPNCHKDFSVRI